MKRLNKGIYILSFLLLSIPFACTEEEDFSIIAGLDFTVATLNAEGTKTGVLPTTVPGDGRIVYTVDFGDPAVTDDSDVFQTSGPMVSYTYPAESVTYTITVTAALDGKEDVSITKEHTVVFVVEEPDTPDNPLVGTWKLASEAGALAVGESPGNYNWWTSDSSVVTDRACLFDDEYVFNADGSFKNVLGADTWLEPWQAGSPAEACGAPIAPHDGSNAATWESTGSTIKIVGDGAFLGLSKVHNAGEDGNPTDDTITYNYTLSDDGNTLEITIQGFNAGVPAAEWYFKLVKQATNTNPLVGTWKLASEAGALAVGESPGNYNWWTSDSSVVTDRACLFDDEYVFNADGSFKNVLGADTWLEPWQAGSPAEACGAPIAPHDGSNAATWESTGSTIKIVGDGAFLGLSKVHNAGEDGNPTDDTITYNYTLSDDGNTLEITIQGFNAGVPAAEWYFKLVK